MDPKQQKRLPLVVLLVGFFVAAILAVSALREDELHRSTTFLPGNPARGAELFYERKCGDCHSIGGAGAREGPSLLLPHTASSEPLEIAAAMWNHAPTMWKRMDPHSFKSLTPRDFADLTTFLFVAGYLEERGDPLQGRRVFMERGCGDCHSLGTHPPAGRADLSRWSSRMNPILWALLLWEHAPAMENAVKKKGLAWPQLSPAEAVDLLAFLRSLGSEGGGTPPLPGDPWVGRLLFRRNCRRCHRVEGKGGDVGPDLDASPALGSIVGLAASLWNHVPAMDERLRELSVRRPSFSEQEMSDLVTYLFSLRFRERPGDPMAGAEVYARSCSACHGARGEGGLGPALGSVSSVSPPLLWGASLWNHGPQMYEQMRSRRMNWPLLRVGEMKDLLAYLNTLSR